MEVDADDVIVLVVGRHILVLVRIETGSAGWASRGAIADQVISDALATENVSTFEVHGFAVDVGKADDAVSIRVGGAVVKRLRVELLGILRGLGNRARGDSEGRHVSMQFFGES